MTRWSLSRTSFTLGERPFANFSSVQHYRPYPEWQYCWTIKNQPGCRCVCNGKIRCKQNAKLPSRLRMPSRNTFTPAELESCFDADICVWNHVEYANRGTPIVTTTPVVPSMKTRCVRSTGGCKRLSYEAILIAAVCASGLNHKTGQMQ